MSCHDHFDSCRGKGDGVVWMMFAEEMTIVNHKRTDSARKNLVSACWAQLTPRPVHDGERRLRPGAPGVG